MTLQQLRVLAAVVEQQSFTRGARAVYMTQSAASQHVRSLEQVLGIPLVERAGGTVLPTPAGEGLLRYAREMLRAAADAERFLSSLRQGHAGRLVLGATGSAVYLVPALVSGLRQAAPEVELSLQVLSRPDLEEALARGTVDVAVMSGPVRHVGLTAVELCPDRLVLVAAPTSCLLPGEDPAPLPLAQVAEQPIIAPAEASASWRLVSAWAEGHGVELRPVLRLDGPDAIKKAVEAGLGLTFLSAWVVEREVTLGTLHVVPVTPAPPGRAYELVLRAGHTAHEPLATLLRFAPEYFQRRQPASFTEDKSTEDKSTEETRAWVQLVTPAQVA
ncbi:MAG: LysR family transcriptional regulator [Chloroflexota bacterium]|nr:LysR family transcriptional regulator [Chloroflexota bacterium]